VKFKPLRHPTPARSSWPSDYLSDYSFFVNGVEYPIRQTMPPGPKEKIPNDFEGYVESIYRRNGVVFACIYARQRLFSEARFQFRRFNNGRPGDLFGGRELAILERPWPNGTTGDLLARMEQDASLAGNFYGARVMRGDGTPMIRRLRPDWVTIVIGTNGREGDPYAPDAEVLGYIYEPAPGTEHARARKTPEVFLPEDVCHYAPIPDPTAQFRGMSWLTPILREASADSGATTHKTKFFENAATPNMVVSLDSSVSEEGFKRFKDLMDAGHAGAANAYKTLYLGGGADVTVVGNSFEQMSFTAVQGHGETRIAAAAGIPPIIVGLSEGLQAATYSNYAQAKRHCGDATLRPLWRLAAGSLSVLVATPPGAELWYDDRDIPFLAEDQKDAITVLGGQAQAVRVLSDAGFDPDAVIAAIMAGDLSLLKGSHSGLFSVQLQEPGSMAAPATGSSPADQAAGLAELAGDLRYIEELESLRAELNAEKAGRRISILRDDLGRPTGLEVNGHVG
jgi:phage portal protein BeeE